MYRAGNSAVKNNLVNIGHAYGDNDIASMWKAHFSDIYNELHDDVSKQQFYYRFNESVHNAESCHVIVSVQDIITAINKQHKNKAAGPDNVKVEAFMCGNLRLYVHLAQLFNLFLKHGYLPRHFMQCTIIPIVI